MGESNLAQVSTS